MEAIEFYSGIGGLAVAAEQLGIRVKLAFDIHPLANTVHKLNFPSVTTSPTTISNLTPKSLPKLYQKCRITNPPFWLLSPPCQPFSRRGLQKDLADQRNASFLHLINLLAKLEGDLLPQYLLVENVACFETSETRNLLVNTLNEKGFKFQEFLLSPTQLGIPNQRLRYYCIAKRGPREFLFGNCSAKINISLQGFQEVGNCRCKPVGEYLENKSVQEMLTLYAVKHSVIDKSGCLFDIKSPESITTNCFTKSYGRYVEGSGSVLETIPLTHESNCKDNRDIVQELKERGLRYFSPREMLRLHGFPETFQFPPETTALQTYKLIGNSLNVSVVRELLRYLLQEPN